MGFRIIQFTEFGRESKPDAQIRKLKNLEITAEGEFKFAING
jgi:hypothetical protein